MNHPRVWVYRVLAAIVIVAGLVVVAEPHDYNRYYDFLLVGMLWIAAAIFLLCSEAANHD